MTDRIEKARAQVIDAVVLRRTAAEMEVALDDLAVAVREDERKHAECIADGYAIYYEDRGTAYADRADAGRCIAKRIRARGGK